MWRNLIIFTKKQFVGYFGKTSMTLSSIFRGSMVGTSHCFGMNKNIIYSVHGVSFEHKCDIVGDSVVAESKSIIRNKELTIKNFGDNNYFPLFQNGVRNPYNVNGRKGVIIVVKASNVQAVLKINNTRHQLLNKDLNRPTIIWFDEDDYVTITTESESGDIGLSLVGYYEETHVETANNFMVFTDI